MEIRRAGILKWQLLLFFLATLPSLTSAGWAQGGLATPGVFSPVATLTPSDGYGGAVFGAEVAVSGDVVAVGSPEVEGGGACPNGGGAIYIYQKPAGGWGNMVQTAELTSNQSCMMVLAAFTGDTIVGVELGCTGEGFYGPGAIYVFVKPEGGWTNMGPTAILSVSKIGGCQGSFAIAAAVNQEQNMIVAAEGPNNRVFIFRKPSGGWANASRASEVLTAPPGSGGFGSAMAMNSDLLAVGAPTTGTGGAVYVFNAPANGKPQQIAVLTPSNPQDDAYIGWGLAMTSDTIATGAPSLNSNQGAIYVFTKPAAGWSNITETARLSVANIPSDYAVFGRSVALDPTGKEVVGGFLSNGPPDPLGYVFIMPSSGWQTTSSPTGSLYANGSGEPGNFCSSVAASAANIVLGAGGTNEETGAAFVFAQ